MKKITDYIRRLAISLSHIGKAEPLSKMALVVIIFLDIFVFITIQDGIYEQSSQLERPAESIPYLCQEIVIRNEWVKDNLLDKVSAFAFQKRYAVNYPGQAGKAAKPECQSIISQLDNIAASDDLSKKFTERKRLKTKYNAYDLYQKQTFSEAKAYQHKLRQLDGELTQHKEIKSLNLLIQKSQVHAQALMQELRQLNFSYPLKQLGMQMLFLLPLLFIFYCWNSRSIKRDNYIQTFLSSHMLVITFFPILWRIAEFIFEIIPKQLLENLFNLLRELKIVGVWHYFIILITIFITLATLYILQKKLFTKARLQLRRALKGLCLSCGLKLPLNSNYCPYCGDNQHKCCCECEKPILKNTEFCKHCGVSQNSNSDVS